MPLLISFLRKHRVMQYHVTCNKCNRAFTITADSGDRMKCTCPYCGQSLLVNLPAMAEPVTPVVQQPVSPSVQLPVTGQGDDDGKGTAVKILLTVLIVLILGGLGVFAFVQWQNKKEAARLELQAQCKAHADSLMQIRAQQEAQEAEAQRVDEQRKSVCNFIKSFYQKAVLVDDVDVNFYERYLTDYCRRMIFGVLEDYESDVEDGTIWWGAFGNTASDPDKIQLLRNLSITPVEGNWYKVRLTQDGATEYRQLKVLTKDGHVLIDDVR